MLSTPALELALPSGLALLAYAVALLQHPARFTRPALIAGWLLHLLAIGVDTLGLSAATPGVRFGFAPALSVTAWFVIAVYVVESRRLPLPGIGRGLAGIGAAAVGLAWIFPGEARPHIASPWEPVHWILGFASYGLFGAALLHAALWRLSERRLRLKVQMPPLQTDRHQESALTGLPLLKLEALTFSFVSAGFVVLSVTLALGWWFTNPWHWTHKAVFSALSWLVFAALLAGRQFFGWRGRVATRWLYLGSGLLLLAYVGSRFVLEIILHRAPSS